MCVCVCVYVYICKYGLFMACLGSTMNNFSLHHCWDNRKRAFFHLSRFTKSDRFQLTKYVICDHWLLWVFFFFWSLVCVGYFLQKYHIEREKRGLDKTLPLKSDNFWINGNIHISFNAGSILLFLVESMAVSSSCKPNSQCLLGNTNTHTHTQKTRF